MWEQLGHRSTLEAGEVLKLTVRYIGRYLGRRGAIEGRVTTTRSIPTTGSPHPPCPARRRPDRD